MNGRIEIPESLEVSSRVRDWTLKSYIKCTFSNKTLYYYPCSQCALPRHGPSSIIIVTASPDERFERVRGATCATRALISRDLDLQRS